MTTAPFDVRFSVDGKQSLYAKAGAKLPAGDWSPPMPMAALPKHIRLNAEGWFVLEKTSSS
jgi:hypothetical protein